jgi:hypothetical protein
MKTLGSPPRGGQPRDEILNPFGIDFSVARVAGVHELARRMLGANRGVGILSNSTTAKSSCEDDEQQDADEVAGAA